MKLLKYLLLVVIIFCSCAKSKDTTTSIEKSDTLNEPTFKSRDFVENDKLYTNDILILQKLNELIELNTLYNNQSKFKKEVHQQILTLIENDSILNNLPDSASIKKLSQVYKYQPINDSIGLIKFSFIAKGEIFSLTAKTITKKANVEDKIVINQQIKFIKE